MKNGRVIRFYFLDASAIVKLLIDENESGRIRAIFPAGGSFHTTFICIAEALNVLKRKWLKKELTQRQYVKAAYMLMSYVEGDLIHISPLSLAENAVFIGTKKIVEQHDLDFSDAFQIFILNNSFFRVLTSPKPLLITADSEFAAAARSVGISVWDCVRDMIPAELGGGSLTQQ